MMRVSFTSYVHLAFRNRACLIVDFRLDWCCLPFNELQEKSFVLVKQSNTLMCQQNYVGLELLQ